MKVYENESGYLQLLKDIRDEGVHHPDRTSVGGSTKVFSRTLQFDVSESHPVHSLRLVSPRLGFVEYWAFMNGVTEIHPHLAAQGINFWEGNTTREFLDSRGLYRLPVGHLGKAYSFQYRNFGGDYTELSKKEGSFKPDFATGYDQIKHIIEGMKKDPFGRRHLVSIWNPSQLDEMTLPPCFWAHNFMCMKRADGGIDLNLKVFARSNDVLFGLSSNYQQFALYLQIVAKYCGFNAKYLEIDITDAHVYDNQWEYVEELLLREPLNNKVTFTLNKELKTFDDFLSVKWDDIVLDGYDYNKEQMVTPRPEMAV